MSPIPPRGPFQRCRFPRVSGDEPYVDQVRAALDSFSPRERG